MACLWYKTIRVKKRKESLSESERLSLPFFSALLSDTFPPFSPSQPPSLWCRKFRRVEQQQQQHSSSSYRKRERENRALIPKSSATAAAVAAAVVVLLNRSMALDDELRGEKNLPLNWNYIDLASLYHQVHQVGFFSHIRRYDLNYPQELIS